MEKEGCWFEQRVPVWVCVGIWRCEARCWQGVSWLRAKNIITHRRYHLDENMGRNADGEFSTLVTSMMNRGTASRMAPPIEQFLNRLKESELALIGSLTTRIYIDYPRRWCPNAPTNNCHTTLQAFDTYLTKNIFSSFPQIPPFSFIYFLFHISLPRSESSFCIIVLRGMLHYGIKTLYQSIHSFTAVY